MGPPFNPHSPQAQAIAGVFSLVLVIAAVVFLVVLAGVVYSVVRYRSRGASASEPKQIFGSRKLETLWTVVPLLILTGLFIVTVRAMVLIDAPEDSSTHPDLVITGHQWWWEVRYPNGVVVPWDIHIPASHRLRARIESADVIHDFWVPELARKIDAVPGRWSFIWLEADTPGSYAGTCSEFCGAQHAWMRFRVVAEPDATFQTWLKNEARGTVDDAPDSAERLFGDKGCAKCHTVVATQPSSGKGPSLAHLASREFLGGGIARNTPENLMLWLTDPQAAKPGNRMPNTPLTAEERRALLMYLESLR
ncbi:MAG TPA: cytochrome c oxidase subunit II [Bryobacteraceae bacterium]|nr:cytochrome c oxidase subunit II [Bryobacteraceae bacterium]